MDSTDKATITAEQLAGALDNLPVGVTIIDPAGHILYFNKYCARFVNRKSEYIGRDIRSCHKEAESVARIDEILKTLKEGREREVHYENKRGARNLAVTVSRLEIDGALIGFIQSFVVKQN